MPLLMMNNRRKAFVPPVVGSFIGVGDAGKVLYSSDGLSWSNRSIASANNLHNVAYGNNVLVVVGANATVRYSYDLGLSWGTAILPGLASNVAAVTVTFNPNVGQFLISTQSTSGTSRMYCSADGATWASPISIALTTNVSQIWGTAVVNDKVLLPAVGATGGVGQVTMTSNSIISTGAANGTATGFASNVVRAVHRCGDYIFITGQHAKIAFSSIATPLTFTYLGQGVTGTEILDTAYKAASDKVFMFVRVAFNQPSMGQLITVTRAGVRTNVAASGLPASTVYRMKYYEEDGVLAMYTSSGIYYSTDEGATFSLASLQVVDVSNLIRIE